MFYTESYIHGILIYPYRFYLVEAGTKCTKYFSFYLSALRDSTSCSMVDDGFPTRSRGFKASRLCPVNCYLATTIYHDMSYPWSSSSLPPPYLMRFPGIPLCQSMPDPSSAWLLMTPASSCYLCIPHTLALLLCIELLCSATGWYTPLTTTFLTPPVSPLWLVTPIFSMVYSNVDPPLVSGIPDCG